MFGRTLLLLTTVVGSSAFAADVEQREASGTLGTRRPQFEVVLFPVRAQVNPLFTTHVGSSGAVQLRLSDAFAFQISAGYDWYSANSTFNAQLVERLRVEYGAKRARLATWTALLGAELSPGLGHLDVADARLGLALVLNAGLGAGGTRHELRPTTTNFPASYGDTGVQFLGSFGAGFRLQLGSNVTLRVEVRDVVMSSRIVHVNGCNLSDLRILDDSIRAARDPGLGGEMSPSCRFSEFTGRDASGGSNSNNVPLALNLVRSHEVELLHNVTAALGMSVVF